MIVHRICSRDWASRWADGAVSLSLWLVRKVHRADQPREIAASFVTVSGRRGAPGMAAAGSLAAPWPIRAPVSYPNGGEVLQMSQSSWVRRPTGYHLLYWSSQRNLNSLAAGCRTWASQRTAPESPRPVWFYLTMLFTCASSCCLSDHLAIPVPVYIGERLYWPQVTNVDCLNIDMTTQLGVELWLCQRLCRYLWQT